MPQLIKPYRTLQPMECPVCGKTLTVFMADVTRIVVNRNGEVVDDTIIDTKNIGHCECGYTTLVTSIGWHFVPDTPYFERYKCKYDKYLESLTNYEDKNIFDKREIEDEIIRKYY